MRATAVDELRAPVSCHTGLRAHGRNHRRRHARAAARCLLSAFILQPAPTLARELPSAPIIRVESGGHDADITGLAVDASSRFIVTCSFDKTIRIWQLDRLEAGPRVIRVPIDGETREGALYALALSPDGNTLVTGGWTGSFEAAWSLYVFDVKSGRMMRRIADLPHRAVSLAYSPDGKLLAVGMKSGKGVQLRRTDNWSVVASDDAYSDDIPSLQFGPAGQLAVVSHDGSITVYGDRLGKKVRVADPSNNAPAVVRFSPDGRTVAVGHSQDPRVYLLDVGDLTVRRTLDARDKQAGFTALEWSQDGRLLFGAGSYERGGLALVRRWSVEPQREARDFPAGQGFITHLRRVGPDRLAFVTTQATLGILDARGEQWWVWRFPGADFRDQQDSFRISGDGTVVEFSFERFGSRRARIALRDKSFALGVAPDPQLLEPLLEAPGLTIKDWRQTKAPTLNGQPIKLMPHETATSLAVAPQAERFVLGTAWRVIGFDRDGGQRWSWDAPSAAWALNVTADGGTVVGAFGDGTIRWFRMSDGTELLSLFAVEDQQRWVAWTPAGFYVASAGGDRLVGWHVNRGRDHAADFFTVSRLRATYNRADMIEAAILRRDDAMTARGEGEPGARSTGAHVEELLPPVVEIVAPEADRAFDTPRLKLVYEVRSRPLGRATRVMVRADGRPIAEFTEPAAMTASAVRRGVEVELPRRDHVLEVVAEGAAGTFSEAASVHLRWTGEEARRKPRLFIVAVGINKYRSSDLALEFSVKDTEDFVAAFRKGEPGTYRRVVVRRLANEEVTLGAIKASLEWLRTSAGPNDVAAVFLSGHGFQDESGHYYYVPVDVGEADVFSRGLADTEIRAALARVSGRVLLFLDTCRSAAVWGYPSARRFDVGRLINDLSSPEIGAYVFASSSGSQSSFESPAWQNGAFTKAIVEGLNEKADLFKKNKVTVTNLDAYVSHRVSELTSGRQTPATGKPVANDFVLLRLK